MPNLSDHDLKQMDPEWVQRQSEQTVRGLLGRALEDLKSARDRLNQTPSNSSRPSGSMPPWRLGTIAAAAREAAQSELKAADEPKGEAAQPEEGTPADDCEEPESAKQAPVAKRAGRAVGARGHGRTQKLDPTRTEQHHAAVCAGCGQGFASHDGAHAWTGWDSLELLPLSQDESGPVVLGVRIEVTRHQLMSQRCTCGHLTRHEASRADEDPMWAGVHVSEQRLLGPRLAAAIVHLCVRMRLPRRKVSELLLEWFGLSLSAALIDQTVHQAARSVAELEPQLAQQLAQAALVHADETSWSECGQALWLWVLCCCHTVLYVVGSRTKEMFDNALDASFQGILMSDGYGAYRARMMRLRCWAHLLRKLRGVHESTDRQAAQEAGRMLDLFGSLIAAVFEARAQLDQPPQDGVTGPAAPPAITHAEQIEQLKQLCQHQRDASHQALRQIAREFINDWQAIVRVLHDPRLPLTNNAAERQLRHYVVARRISYGTRNPVGSHSFALLASIFDTCRLRGASATDLLARSIHAARMKLPSPCLPPIPCLLAPAYETLS